MRRRLLTVIAAAVFSLSAVAGAGAFWTADGIDPARCGHWSDRIAHGGPGAADAQYYFDRYNCEWVEEEPEEPTEPESNGTRFLR